MLSRPIPVSKTRQRVEADSGRFHALDPGTGQQHWSVLCGGPVQASPAVVAVVGGVVLVAANGYNIYSLDRHTRRKLWNHRLHRLRHHSIQAPPVVHGRRVFVAQWHDWV